MYQKNDIVELIVINKYNDYFSYGKGKNLSIYDQFIILNLLNNFEGWYEVRELKTNEIFILSEKEIQLVNTNKTHLPNWF